MYENKDYELNVDKIFNIKNEDIYVMSYNDYYQNNFEISFKRSQMFSFHSKTMINEIPKEMIAQYGTTHAFKTSGFGKAFGFVLICDSLNDEQKTLNKLLNIKNRAKQFRMIPVIIVSDYQGVNCGGIYYFRNLQSMIAEIPNIISEIDGYNSNRINKFSPKYFINNIDKILNIYPNIEFSQARSNGDLTLKSDQITLSPSDVGKSEFDPTHRTICDDIEDKIVKLTKSFNMTSYNLLYKLYCDTGREDRFSLLLSKMLIKHRVNHSLIINDKNREFIKFVLNQIIQDDYLEKVTDFNKGLVIYIINLIVTLPDLFDADTILPLIDNWYVDDGIVYQHDETDYEFYNSLIASYILGKLGKGNSFECKKVEEQVKTLYPEFTGKLSDMQSLIEKYF